MAEQENSETLRTLIVDDEPLAVERMQVICAKLDDLSVVGTANDGAAALRLVDAIEPDHDPVVLLAAPDHEAVGNLGDYHGDAG